MQSSWIDVSKKLEKTRQDSEKSVGSKSLKGSNIWGRLGLKGFLLFVYSNFIL